MKTLILVIGEWIDDRTFQPERMWNLEDLKTEEQKQAMLKVIFEFGFENALK